MGTNMDIRIEQLELKVDKFSELFNEMITNQRLMQRELSLLSETLQKVNDMKLFSIECATNTNSRLTHLELECTKKENSINLVESETKESFKLRDKYMVGFAISLILMAVSKIIGGM